MKIDFKSFDLKKYLKKSHKAQNIYIEPKSCNEYAQDSTLPLPQYSRDNFYIGNIPARKINQSTIVVPNEIDPSEVAVAYEDDIVEDLAIDIEKEYIIRVEKSDVDMGSSTDEYLVYVLEHECLERLYGSCSSTNHIDVIVPTPILFKPLLDVGLVEPKGVNLFFWYEEDECFASVYSDGRFLGYRLLKHSLDELLELFNESSPSLINKEQLLELLSKEDIDADFESALKRVYSVIAEDIDDSILFFRRIYHFDEYKNAYVDSKSGFGTLLYEYLEASYGRKSEEFSFLESIGASSKSETIQALGLFYAQSGNIDENLNFTIFPKPKPLIQRDSGRLVVLALLGAILAFSMPIYFFAKSYTLELENSNLQEKRDRLEVRAKKLESNLKELQEGVENKKSSFQEAKKNRDALLSLLSSYTAAEDEYVSKSEVLLNILSLLQKDSLYLKELSFYKDSGSDVFELNIIANSDDDISSFVDRAIKDGGYDIDINEISQIDNRLYESKLKVVVR
ncbi:MAG: coiled-coil domain-containing protein [Campylobacterales bacterium]